MTDSINQTFYIKHQTIREDIQRMLTYLKSYHQINTEQVDLMVKITDKKETRRCKQNRLMWRWHNEFCKFRYETAGEVFSPEAWHEEFAKQFLGTKEPEKVNGNWVIVRKSTKDISVKEFADMLTRYQAECAGMGLQLTSNDDLYREALMRGEHG